MFSGSRRTSPGIYRRLLALQESGLFHSNTRIAMLRIAGITVGREVLILSGVHFACINCEIGDHVFINQGCFFDGPEWVRIKNNVFIGPGVRILTGTHQMGPAGQRAGTPVSAPVTIREGCWLGAGAMILPGVVIAEGCMIGAGSVVLKSTHPNGLYVGVPAKRIRELEPASQAEYADAIQRPA